MSRARNVANLGADTTNLEDISSAYSAGALSNRNLIINGAMQVWQRGTSFTPNPVIFGADRFAAYKATASAGDYARSTDVPAGQGFTYSGYFNAADIRHSVELPATGERGVFVDGSQWTLSFWVKAGASGTSTANLGWANGVSASSLTNWGADQSYSYSTSWEKKTITFTVSGSITGSHAAVLLYMPAVSGGLYITGVQLEAGDTATPFEHRSYGQELALCQRYTRVIGDGISGVAPTAAALYCNYTFNQPMRAAPTVTLTDTTVLVSDQYFSDHTSTGSAIIGNNQSSIGGRTSINGFSGLTIGRFYAAYGNTNQSFFLLSAEL